VTLLALSLQRRQPPDYRMLQRADPAVAKFLLGRARGAVDEKWRHYKQLAERK
jgi:hypothetical protein